MTRVTRERERPTVDATAHHVLARAAAAEGTVLLRNEENVLPLAPGARVALIGDFARTPRYQGAGSSSVNPTRLTSLVDSFPATGLTLAGFAAGFTRVGTPDAALRAEAVELAAAADIVVLSLGLPESFESEGLDRSHLRLPDEQVKTLDAVAATGTPVIVVLSGGGAIETPWLGRTAALVHAYLGGQAGAEAVWDVLTGTVEPGGRLAETLPVSISDDPTASSFPSEGRTAEYREGLFTRYRYHDTAGVAPAFGFGFGLGYTTWASSDLELTAAGATFTVRNTGARAGSDVAQLYVRRVSPSGVTRPHSELKGFAKVRLAAGERTRIHIPFTPRTFRHFDIATGAWQTERGDFEVLVGRHLGDLPLRATHQVEGIVVPGAEGVAPSGIRQPFSADAAAFAGLLGRPLPDPAWGVPPIGANTPMDQLAAAPSFLARRIFRLLEGRRHKADAAGAPDLNLLFLYNAPFRVIHKMSGGMATRRLTEGILDLVNGRGVRSLGRIVGAFFSGRRAEKLSRREFERAAAGTRARGGQ